MTESTDKPADPPRRTRPLGSKPWRLARWLLGLAVLAGLVYGLELTRFVKWPFDGAPGFFKAEPHPETALYTRKAVGVPMADRFRSYEDLQAVTAALTAAGVDGWTASSRRAAESPDYPPYRVDTLRVEPYRHLDAEGSLSLQFFNDRLFQVEFAPADAERYARRLRALGLQRDANARAEKIDGNLRLASTVELAISPVGRQLRTQPYVIWQDLRLVRERDEWDQKFGAIPKSFTGP